MVNVRLDGTKRSVKVNESEDITRRTEDQLRDAVNWMATIEI